MDIKIIISLITSITFISLCIYFYTKWKKEVDVTKKNNYKKYSISAGALAGVNIMVTGALYYYGRNLVSLNLSKSKKSKSSVLTSGVDTKKSLARQILNLRNMPSTPDNEMKAQNLCSKLFSYEDSDTFNQFKKMSSTTSPQETKTLCLNHSKGVLGLKS